EAACPALGPAGRAAHYDEQLPIARCPAVRTRRLGADANQLRPLRPALRTHITNDRWQTRCGRGTAVLAFRRRRAPGDHGPACPHSPGDRGDETVRSAVPVELSLGHSCVE